MRRRCKSSIAQAGSLAKFAMPSDRMPKLLKCALAVAAFVSICHEATAMMPPNPDRPVVAATCKEAIRVLREAIAGNPLATASQDKQRVAQALALVELHCVDAPSSPKTPSKP